MNQIFKNNKTFMDLYSLLYTPTVCENILREFDDYKDYLTNELIDTAIQERTTTLENTGIYNFDCLGIINKKDYITSDIMIFENLLEPMLSLNDWNEKDASAKEEALSHIEMSARKILLQLDDYKANCYNNFLFGYPIAVENFLYNMDNELRLFNDIISSATRTLVNLSKTPLYQIILEWLDQMKREFSPAIIQRRLSHIETGHILLKPINQVLFKDLFTQVQLYEQVLKELIKEEYIDANTGKWTGKGKKEIFAGYLKKLEKEGYFKDGYKLTNSLYNSAIKNSFGFEISDSVIDRAKPTDITVKRPINQNKKSREFA